MEMKKLKLQLFAEGSGASASTGTVAEGTGENSQDAADNTTGRDSEGSVVQDDTADNNRPSFEDLIKGEYKQDFDDKIHAIIRKKTAEIKSQRERLESMNPILDLLSSKYGIDATDLGSIEKAILSDNAYLEEEAVERGMSVDQLRLLKQTEHENKILKDTIERNRKQTETDRIYNEWMNQAESLKETYPNFDFMVEAQNNDFAQLLRNGIDVRTAYEVIHKDEIIQGAMAVTAQKVKESVTNDIRANGNRPSENGTSNQSAAGFTIDKIKKLTKAERKSLGERAARGERITF